MKGTGEAGEAGPMEHNQLGTEWLVELYGCPKEKIAKAGAVEEIIVSAAKASCSIITKTIFHDFNVEGVNGMVSTLSGAYYAVHTWPDKGYAAIDIFSDGSPVMAEETAAFMAERFEAKESFVYRVPRGRFDAKGRPAPLKRLFSEGLATLEVPRLVRAASVLFGLIF